MARKRYFPRPTHAVFGTAFDTPEEAWLWAARSVRIAAEGAQTAADRAVVQRPCEPRDLITLVCRLRRQRVLNGYEMHALCAFGAMDRPPDPRDPEEARHDRFWQSGLDRLTGPLVRKGIVLPRRSEMRELPLDLKKEQKMNKNESALTGRRLAIIAYTGTAAFAPLRLLRRRYRHCLILVQVPPYWIAVDSVIGRISYAVLDLQGVGEYLIALHGLGYRCQVARTRPVTVRRWRPMPLTCVEVVKRTLGMDDLGVWTPYQLFRRIKRTN